MPVPASRTLERSGSPAGSQPVLPSGGQPLDALTRSFLEPRFGHDFSQVRVHADPQAAGLAQALDARAFTAGNHVVMGPNQYSPGTPEGRRLLAHELTHVVQQTSRPGPHPVQRKDTKARPKPFYQEALDELERTRKADVVTLSTGGEIDMFQRVPVIEKFIALAQAIDAGAEVKERLDEFLAAQTTRLPLGLPSDALVNTMVARLLLLGLGQEAARFRTWYHKHEKEVDFTPKRGPATFRSEEFLWEQVLDELLGRIPQQGADDALKVLDALLLLFEQIRDEAAGLDPAAIKKDRERWASLSSLTHFPVIRETTISVYYDSLLRLLRNTFTGIQTAYQVVLDQAVADLGAGRGDKYLNIAKDRLEGRLRGLIEPKEENKRSGSMAVEVTKSEFKKGGGKHLDFFATGKAAASRAVGIEFYDEEMFESLAAEKEMSFSRIFLVRRDQIQVLERIYGLEKDKDGNLTAESKENAKAIANLGTGGMKLESDDDWRRFLLEKYKERAATSNPAEAFTAVIKLLETFLRAFTTHTPYNIEDFGDNLLTRQFPRALTGQLIQDCGVYALRIAYMLSLLRDHLKLRFRFIALPVHVGLIITGENLPLYIAHNDSVVIYSQQDMAFLSKEWAALDEQGQARTAPKADEAQMVAELAALEFIPGVDLPFKLLEVPKTAGSPAAAKSSLWSFYTGTLGSTKLFGPKTEDPKSPVYQLHLKYLKVLDSIKAHHNEYLRPFWNDVAHPLWLKHKPVLEKALADIAAAKGPDEKKAAEAAYDEAFKLYLDELQKAFEVVETKHSAVVAEQVELIRILQENPDALGKGAGRTHSARMEELIQTPWWSRVVYEHISELRSRKAVQAPFEKKEDLLTPMD